MKYSKEMPGVLFTRLQDFISTLIIEISSFNTTPISTFSATSVSEIWQNIA